MVWLKINNVAMPTPTSFKIQLSDLDSEETSRNENGIMSRDRIRAGVYKCQYTWTLTTAQSVSLTNALAPQSFTVTFYDTITNTYKTKTMYAGDKTSSVLLPKSNQGETWIDYACNLIEL